MNSTFSAVSATWIKVLATESPHGYWMKPSSPKVHQLNAKNWKQADKEVETLQLEPGYKLWAYGETSKVLPNCGLNV